MFVFAPEEFTESWITDCEREAFDVSNKSWCQRQDHTQKITHQLSGAWWKLVCVTTLYILSHRFQMVKESHWCTQKKKIFASWFGSDPLFYKTMSKCLIVQNIVTVEFLKLRLRLFLLIRSGLI